jgi:outer membrane receptor for ferrienterochelin and colicin
VEFTISGEYAVHPNVIISAGYTYSETKVEDSYQNEVDYVLPGHTLAFGAKVKINENVSLEGGVLNVIYNKQEFKKNYEPFAGRLNLPAIFDQTVHNTADGRVMLLAIGANISMPGPSN